MTSRNWASTNVAYVLVAPRLVRGLVHSCTLDPPGTPNDGSPGVDVSSAAETKVLGTSESAEVPSAIEATQLVEVPDAHTGSNAVTVPLVPFEFNAHGPVAVKFEHST